MQTNIYFYFVYEYKGNKEADIKPYKGHSIAVVNSSNVINGVINQYVYADMLKKAKESIEEDNNITLSDIKQDDIIITFWSEINNG